MSIQFNVDLNRIYGNNDAAKISALKNRNKKQDFSDTIKDSLGKVNEKQSEANASINDLLTGRQQDVNSVVSSVAKADMSFKLLVGVRNKLVDAYKETMKMM